MLFARWPTVEDLLAMLPYSVTDCALAAQKLAMTKTPVAIFGADFPMENLTR
jgi:hypothetical protein